jgi:ribosome biogenesis ATPase
MYNRGAVSYESKSQAKAAAQAARAAEFAKLSDNDKARKVAQYAAKVGAKKAAKLGLYGDGPGGFNINNPPGLGPGAGGAAASVAPAVSAPPSLSFADVGGIEAILQDVRELIEYPLTHPEIYEHLGVEPPRGVLLHGPPGCGKTMLAHAIAGELKVPFLKISAPEIVSGMSGESEAKIRSLFAEAQAQAPCILFIDEIDAIAPKRADAQREMERRIVAQMLTCMDSLGMQMRRQVDAPTEEEDAAAGAAAAARELAVAATVAAAGGAAAAAPAAPAKKGFESLAEFAMRANNDPSYEMVNGEMAENAGGAPRSRAVIVIGATNRPDSIDSALRRAGRFDREIAIGIPDDDARARILRVMCRNMRVDPTCDFAALTKRTVGFVGADLAALTREAAVIAVNRIFADSALWDRLSAGAGASASSRSGRRMRKNKAKLRERKMNDSDSDDEDDDDDDDSDNGDDDEGEDGSDDDSDDDDCESKTVSLSRSASVSAAGGVDNSNIVASRGLTRTEIKDELLRAREQSSDRLRAFTGQTLSAEQLKPLFILEADFDEAIKKVQPTAKREGFAMVPDVTWADVGALDELQAELDMAIVQPIMDPKLFESIGLAVPAGVLLFGPPGCGKTLVAKAVANQSGASFLSIKGPELLNQYVGESERAVRQVFQRARTSAPCVIFFDELDALCPRRGTGGNQASERVVNQLLTELDGMDDRRNVFVIAATNRPDIIDPAMLRPGRLDKLLYIALPDAEGRYQILAKHVRRTPLAPDVDLRSVAADPRAEGFSGADMSALVREATIQSLREVQALRRAAATPAAAQAHKVLVTAAHLTWAFRKVRASVSDESRRKYDRMHAKLAQARATLDDDTQPTASIAAPAEAAAAVLAAASPATEA